MWVTECAASSCIPLAIHVSFSGWLVAWLHRAYHPAKQQSHSSTFYRIPRFGCFAGARVNWHLISSFYMKCHQKWQGWDRERGRDTKDYQAILSRCFILRIPMTIGRHVAAQIHGQGIQGLSTCNITRTIWYWLSMAFMKCWTHAVWTCIGVNKWTNAYININMYIYIYAKICPYVGVKCECDCLPVIKRGG